MATLIRSINGGSLEAPPFLEWGSAFLESFPLTPVFGITLVILLDKSLALSLAGAFGEASLGELADAGSALEPNSSKASAFPSLGLTAGSRVPAI